MSQTWHLPLLTTDTLSDSRGYINDAFAALRTKFSGSSAPSSPVQGQDFVDTDDNVWSVYNGASWTTVGDLDTAYLGLLPRSAGSSYPLSGALYCGSQQVKQVATPTDTTDATTKAYTDAKAVAGGTFTGAIAMGANKATSTRTTPDDDTEFVRKDYVDGKLSKAGGTMTGNIAMGSNSVTGLPSQSDSTPSDYAANCSYLRGKFDTSTGHDHDGTDSKYVPFGNLDLSIAPSGAAAASVPFTVGTAINMVVPWATDYVASPTIDSTYADVCEVVVTLPTTTTSLFVQVVVGAPATYLSAITYGIRLQNASNATLVEDASWAHFECDYTSGEAVFGGYVPFTYKFTPGATGSYTITAQIRANRAITEKHASLLVLMC